jgi:RpiR family carbohydrate utilization transcriptional regulator
MNEKRIDDIPRSCLIKIRSVYDTVKRAERKAIDFILEHPKDVAGLTIVEFAGRAGCSEATIVRVAKRLGYRGYPEMRESFAAVDGGGEILDYGGIKRSDTYAAVARKVFEASIVALKDTLGLMNDAHFQKAVSALLSARKLLICGVGDAHLVALEAYQRFVRIGENCQVSEDPDLQLIMAAHLAEGDALLAISHSGRSRTVLDVVKQARNAGATIIAITNYPVSPIAKHADIVLLTAAFSQHHTGEVISKRISELCIIESLYINYLMKKGQPALRRLKLSNDAVRVHKLPGGQG